MTSSVRWKLRLSPISLTIESARVKPSSLMNPLEPGVVLLLVQLARTSSVSNIVVSRFLLDFFINNPKYLCKSSENSANISNFANKKCEIVSICLCQRM